jgi:hypothetical protein
MAERSPWSMCWRLTLERELISYAIIAVLWMIGDRSHREDLPSTALEFFVQVVLVAPVSETLLYQALPISVLRWFRAPLWLQVAGPLVLFLNAHTGAGPGPALAAGLTGGFYLSWGYAQGARKSIWTALWTTTTQNMLGNATVFAILACAGVLSWTTLKSQWVGGGGYAVCYLYTPDHTLKLALAVSDRRPRPLIIADNWLTSDADCVPPAFTLLFLGESQYACRYQEGSHSIAIGNQMFDLTKGTLLLLSPEHPGSMRIAQYALQIDLPKGSITDKTSELTDAIQRALAPPVFDRPTSVTSTQPSGRD